MADRHYTVSALIRHIACSSSDIQKMVLSGFFSIAWVEVTNGADVGCTLLQIVKYCSAYSWETRAALNLKFKFLNEHFSSRCVDGCDVHRCVNLCSFNKKQQGVGPLFCAWSHCVCSLQLPGGPAGFVLQTFKAIKVRIPGRTSECRWEHVAICVAVWSLLLRFHVSY